MQSWNLMDLTRRLVVGALGALLVALATGVLLATAGVVPALELTTSGVELAADPHAQASQTLLIWAGASFAAIAVGLLLLRLALAGRRRLELVEIGSSEAYGGGALRVGLRGLVALVARAAREVPGVTEVVPSIELSDRSWRVRCELSFSASVAVAEAAQAVVERVRGELHRHTGIPVGQIDLVGDLGLGEAQRSLV